MSKYKFSAGTAPFTNATLQFYTSSAGLGGRARVFADAGSGHAGYGSTDVAHIDFIDVQ